MVARCKLRRAKPTSFSKYLPIYLWNLSTMAKTVTLQVPGTIYQRLVNTALGTRRSLEEVMLHALKVSSPPDWDNVADEFKADLAALDRMEDEALWKIATARKTAADMARYDELLERSLKQSSNAR